MTLKEWRVAKNLPQQWIADRLKCSRATVCRYESCDRIPRLKTIRAIQDMTAGQVGFRDWVDQAEGAAA
jgi:transcriptional regulator with XRE-family HTH domain